jgi:MFS family permease
VTRHDPYAPLRVPAFRLYIVGLFSLTLATQMQAVVVGWQMYAATHDPLALGLIGLAEALPFISLALFAGHTADHRDRRKITMAALCVLLGCAIALLTITLRAPGGIPVRVWPVFVVVAVSGVARSFLAPARTALSAELVPRALWPSSIAWRGSSWQLAAVAGPAVGGLIYGFAGPHEAYVVDATLLAVALTCMTSLRYTPRVAPPSTERITVSLTSGVRHVFSQQALLGAITLDLFGVLFGGVTALLPIFASEILRVGPQGLGFLQAAPAAGSVVMSLTLAHWPLQRHVGSILFGAVATFGVCMIGFALSHSVVLSLALLAVSGMADNVSVVIRSTLLQVLTPDHLLGRVSAVNLIFVGSSNEIGAFESGVAAKLLGTVPSVIFGGVMTLLVVATLAWRAPALRTLRTLT